MMSGEEINKKKELFLETIQKKNYHIGKCCTSIGISRTTFYNWKKEDEDFSQKYDEILEYDLDDSEEKMKLLRQGIPEFDKTGKFVGWKERPHFQALLAHLKSKAKDRGWGDSLEITKPMEDARSFTDEELFEQLNKMNKQIVDGEWDTSKDGKTSKS